MINKIVLEKDKLAVYSLSQSSTIRRKILSKYASKDWGKVVKRLNILAIFNKYNHPNTAFKLRQDMKYIQQHFGTKRSIKKHSIKKLIPHKLSKKRSIKKHSIKKLIPHKQSKKRSIKKQSKKLSIKKQSTKQSIKKRSKKRSIKKQSKKRSRKY